MSRGRQIVFGPFNLDLVNLTLFRGSSEVSLTPKAFDVLSYLLQHAGQLVTKDDLLKSIWPESFVGDSVLKVCVLEIRKALGDQAAAPSFIETVHRRGYRFIGSVDSSPTSTGIPERQRLPSRSLPSRQVVEPSGPVVGRESALQELGRYLSKALDGERQTVFVTGEAGMGKTTILDVFLNSLASEPSLRIARGQCLEHYGIGEAYMPVLDAFSRLCRVPENAALLNILSRHAPTWLAQMPSLADPADSAQLQRQTLGATPERMLREMTEALEVMAAESPIVLALEDLHWSDYSTMDLIAYLARRREPAPLLIVATYRPVEVILSRHPLRTVKQELQMHQRCVELGLEFLSEAAVLKYLEFRFCGGAISQELARFVHAHTDGNPLFVVNVVDFLNSQGRIVQREGQWELQAESERLELQVPPNLREMIDRQLGRLVTEEQALLEAASVAGVGFSACTVAAALNISVVEGEERLTDLAKRGQFLRSLGVHEFSDGTVTSIFSFVHSLYQNVIYRHLTESRRQRFHQLIGERLESAYGPDRQQIAAELAIHFEHARDYFRAIHYLRQAAERATRRYANREANEYLTRALKWVDYLPQDARNRVRIELLEQRGLVRRSMADMKQAAQDFEARVECAREEGWLELEVKALFQLCSVLSWFDLRRCLETSQHAAARSSHVSDELLRAHALGSSAYWHLLLEGWNGEDARSGERAVETARRLNDRWLLSLHLPRLAYFQCLHSEYSLACHSTEEGMQIALEIGDASDYMIGQFFQAWALLRLGQWERLLPLLRSALEMAEKNGHQPWATAFRLELAWAYQQMFCFEPALKLCQEAFRKAQELQFGYGQLMSSVLLGCSYLGLHDIDSAARCFQALDDRLRQERLLMDWIWRIPLRLGQGRCSLARGEFAQARIEAHEAFEMAAQPGERAWMAAARNLSVEISLAEPNYPLAEQDLSRALDAIEGIDLPRSKWQIYASAAALCEHQGRKQEARQYWTQSASILAQLAGRLGGYPDQRQTFVTSSHLPVNLRHTLAADASGAITGLPARKAARASSRSPKSESPY